MTPAETREGEAPAMTYDAGTYWSTRLAKHWSLKGVGHRGYSDHYNTYLYKAKTRAIGRAIAKHRIPVQGRRVLDVGSGVGFWIDYYKKAGVTSVAGMDVAEESVRRLRESHPRTRFWCANASEPWPFDQTFDLVNAWDVLYHITDRAAFTRAVRNMAAHVAPGGYLLITDNLPAAEHRPAEHVCFHPLDDYRRALERSGCDVVDVIPVCGLVNGRPFDRMFAGNRTWRKRSAQLEERLVPLFYLLDGIWVPPGLDNLKLLVAHRRAAQ